jgi:NACHT domain
MPTKKMGPISWPHAVLPWLIGAAVGPAVVAVPVNWAADVLAEAAQRWFRRLRHTDDLSRLIRAAVGVSIELSRSQFRALQKCLEDEQTWRTLGNGSLADLTSLIESSLPSRDDWSSTDAQAVSSTVARGLLEFAVADLEPKLFQKVLLARLQRMETSQSSALDDALLSLQADLAFQLGALGEIGKGQFDATIEYLKQVLDRVSSGPASRGEITLYLSVLIDWLNTDPWPRRFDSPPLAPASIERKLRVAEAHLARKDEVDADSLARECHRLVIIGGPGSGKTWLAKRVARISAENALKALAENKSIDEIELPIYTTCSQLQDASGNIRNAVVSSALDRIGDLGGARISATLHTFFAERNAPTLLVIDSLDEAPGVDERLRQADTLPWRVVLTSRSSSWSGQLDIKENDLSYRVGELRSLRYPDDVEAFIKQWFRLDVVRGEDLIGQIRFRTDLQEAATIPLILAFCCIIGGGEPLPELRHDLYARVLRRMLTGRWRGTEDRLLDVDACIRALDTWAWSGAVNDSISGLGAWQDHVSTVRTQLNEAEQHALDNIATPISRPNVDTGEVSRRFLHRSIREYLVGAHVSRLALEEAAEVLLPHIWYDPDWESPAPMALAMHPERDRLLQLLMFRTVGSEEINKDISNFDGLFEFRNFLARLPSESNYADWSLQTATLIVQAQVALVRSGRTEDLRIGGHWGASNRLVYAELARRLERNFDEDDGIVIVDAILGLHPTEAEKQAVRRVLLAMLRQADSRYVISRMVASFVRLGPTVDEKKEARNVLLAALSVADNSYTASGLVASLIRLDPTHDDNRYAYNIMYGKLAEATGNRLVWWADGLALLDLTAEDKREVRETLLGLLHARIGGGTAGRLVRYLVKFEPTDDEIRKIRELLLGRLAGRSGKLTASGLVSGLTLLDPTGEEKKKAREIIGSSLEQAGASRVMQSVSCLLRLDPTEEEQSRMRNILLQILSGQVNGNSVVRLVRYLNQLDPTEHDKYRAREVILNVKMEQGGARLIARLTSSLISLNPTEDDKCRARSTLTKALTNSIASNRTARLVRILVKLDPSEEDMKQARKVILGVLMDTTERDAAQLIRVLSQVNPTTDDLTNWQSWASVPTDALLAAVRRNSDIHTWIDTLESLQPLS